MKVRLINKEGLAWDFKSVEAAKGHIRKEQIDNYEIIDGVKVYDDRETWAGR